MTEPALDPMAVLRRRHERERRARLEAEAIAERITREYYEVSRRLAEAQQMARLGSWDWDILHDTVTASEELYRTFGWPPAAPLSYSTFFERAHPDDRPDLDAAVRKAHAEHSDLDVEFRIVLPSGETRYVHARGELHFDSAGDPVRLSGTTQDVTTHRLAEAARADAEHRAREIERLKEVDRFKTRFINTAAHEVFTPLTPLRLSVDILRGHAKKSNDPLLLRQTELLQRNVVRLHELASALLDATRLDVQQLGLQKTKVEVRPLCERAVRDVAGAAERGGITLAVEAPELTFQADPERLLQVLGHLLGNAIKFSQRGGKVRLVAERRAEALVLGVHDDGRGMTKDEIGKAFLPFNRAHSEENLTQPGAGLGLYICKGIVSLHGGSIAISSPGVGHGTSVEVRLPLDG